MMRIVLVAVALMAILTGCTRTGISAQDTKDAMGAKPSESEMERELKKAGKWEEYKQIKERDAAVERRNREAAAQQSQTQNEVQGQ